MKCKVRTRDSNHSLEGTGIGILGSKRNVGDVVDTFWLNAPDPDINDFGPPLSVGLLRDEGSGGERGTPPWL